MNDALLTLYRQALYVVEAEQSLFKLRVGSTSAQLDRLLKSAGTQTAAFLTACNPHSQRLSDEENQKRQHRLVKQLAAAGWLSWPGYGTDDQGKWPREESLLVAGLSLQEARHLAEQYEQLAFLYCRAGRAVELVVTGG